MPAMAHDNEWIAVIAHLNVPKKISDWDLNFAITLAHVHLIVN